MRLIELGVAGEAYVRWRLEKFGDTMAELALPAVIVGFSLKIAVTNGVSALAVQDFLWI